MSGVAVDPARKEDLMTTKFQFDLVDTRNGKVLASFAKREDAVRNLRAIQVLNQGIPPHVVIGTRDPSEHGRYSAAEVYALAGV
jgi:hypothetical protein